MQVFVDRKVPMRIRVLYTHHIGSTYASCCVDEVVNDAEGDILERNELLFVRNIIPILLVLLLKKLYRSRDDWRTPVGHRTYVDRRWKRLVAAGATMSTVGARDVTRDRRRRHSHHGGRQRQPPELQGGHPRRRSLVSAAAATLVSCAQHALPLSHHLTLFDYPSTYIHHSISV